MTVQNNPVRQPFTGDGVTAQFSFNFRADSDTVVKVLVDGVAPTGGYTVSRNNDQINNPGGNVTITPIPVDQASGLIYRESPRTQTKVYPISGSFPSKSHEYGLDDGVMIAQEQQDELSRAVLAPVTDDGTTDYTPPPYDAGKAWVWDETEKKLRNSIYDATDLGNAILRAETAATNAETSATNAATSEANAAASASNAATSEANAAQSAVDAAASAASITKGGDMRQTVFSGRVNSFTGRGNFVQPGTGLTTGLYGAQTPIVLSFANGYAVDGPVDSYAQYAVDNASLWTLPAGTAGSPQYSFLYLEDDGAGGVTPGSVQQTQPGYGNVFVQCEGHEDRSLNSFNGANGATSSPDFNPNISWNFNGGAQLSVAQAKFGSASLVMPSFADYVDSSTFNVHAGGFRDGFMIEAWIYPTAFNDLNDMIFGGADNFKFALGLAATTHTLKIWLGNGTTWSIANGVTGGSGVPGNTWRHVAVIFDGLQYTVYLQGVAQFSVASAVPFTETSGFQIGTHFASASGFGGYIDEFRYATFAVHRPPSFPVRTKAYGNLALPNEHWFDTSEMKMKAWNDTTDQWDVVKRVFVGESRMSDILNIGTKTYAIRGKYDSNWIDVNSTTRYDLATDLGFVPEDVKFWLRRNANYRNAQGGLAYGDTSLSVFGAWHERVDRDTIRVDFNSPGATNSLGSNTFNPGSWPAGSMTQGQMRVICQRGW